MNKKERVDAALRGDKVDRVPVSMWGHDFEREWSPQALAEAMIENYARYDWDFMKVNPRATTFVEDWKACAVPWKLELSVAGTPSWAMAPCTALVAWPSATPCARLKLMVIAGNWP